MRCRCRCGMLVSVRAKEPSTDASAQPHDEVAATAGLFGRGAPSGAARPADADSGPFRRTWGSKDRPANWQRPWRPSESRSDSWRHGRFGARTFPQSELPLSISPPMTVLMFSRRGGPRVRSGTVNRTGLALVRDRYARSCSICRPGHPWPGPVGHRPRIGRGVVRGCGSDQ